MQEAHFKMTNRGKIWMLKRACHNIKYTNEISQTKRCFRKRIDW